MIRRWRLSLFGQLLISQLVLLFVLAVALPAIILIDLDRTADDYVGQRLSADAGALVRALEPQVDIASTRLTQRLGPLYLAPWGSRAYRVSESAGRVIASGGVGSAVPPSRGCDALGLQHLGKLDIYCRQAIFRDQRVEVMIAQDRTRPEVIVDDVVAGFLARTLWIIPLILLCSTAASLLVVRRVTRQLHGASEAADRIAPSRLDVRINGDALPLEARGLATATNAALDRVEAGFKRQTNFIASVAHELRTPLALLALRCDALPRMSGRDSIRAAIDQLAHVVDQLMDLAAIEARQPALQPVNLEQIARTTIEDLAPIVYRAQHTIELADCGVGATVGIGNAGLLRIALSNLVDNAVHHTPAGTHIVVKAGDGLLAVSDDGPGIRTVDGQKFHSAGNERSDSAGLGLAIVQRIMAAMDGHMTVATDVPGTAVTLNLLGEEPQRRLGKDLHV